MGVGKDKKQVPVILPIKILELIDDDAQKELRSRSSQITKIIMEHYEEKGKQKDM
jgi:hypothetical protein